MLTTSTRQLQTSPLIQPRPPLAALTPPVPPELPRPHSGALSAPSRLQPGHLHPRRSRAAPGERGAGRAVQAGPRLQRGVHPWVRAHERPWQPHNPNSCARGPPDVHPILARAIRAPAGTTGTQGVLGPRAGVLRGSAVRKIVAASQRWRQVHPGWRPRCGYSSRCTLDEEERAGCTITPCGPTMAPSALWRQRRLSPSLMGPPLSRRRSREPRSRLAGRSRSPCTPRPR